MFSSFSIKNYLLLIIVLGVVLFNISKNDVSAQLIISNEIIKNKKSYTAQFLKKELA